MNITLFLLSCRNELRSICLRSVEQFCIPRWVPNSFQLAILVLPHDESIALLIGVAMFLAHLQDPAGRTLDRRVGVHSKLRNSNSLELRTPKHTPDFEKGCEARSNNKQPAASRAHLAIIIAVHSNRPQVLAL